MPTGTKIKLHTPKRIYTINQVDPGHLKEIRDRIQERGGPFRPLPIEAGEFLVDRLENVGAHWLVILRPHGIVDLIPKGDVKDAEVVE